MATTFPHKFPPMPVDVDAAGKWSEQDEANLYQKMLQLREMAANGPNKHIRVYANSSVNQEFLSSEITSSCHDSSFYTSPFPSLYRIQLTVPPLRPRNEACLHDDDVPSFLPFGVLGRSSTLNRSPQNGEKKSVPNLPFSIDAEETKPNAATAERNSKQETTSPRRQAKASKSSSAAEEIKQAMSLLGVAASSQLPSSGKSKELAHSSSRRPSIRKPTRSKPSTMMAKTA